MPTRFLRVALAIAVSIGIAREAFADRATVEKALGEMSAAAAAADPDAYLAHVSRSDPIFYKEQLNWAKDLKRKPPAKVAFSIGKAGGDGPEPQFGASKASFEMVTRWTMPVDKGEAKARELSFPVTFVLEEGKWLYAGEDWLVLEGGRLDAQPADKPADAGDNAKPDDTSDEEPGARPRDPRFQGPPPGADASGAAKAHSELERMARVKYFSGYEEVAKRIVQVLPEVREHVDEGFGAHIARAQEVKIYPSMRHLQESIYLSYVDGLSGWNEPGEAIKIITRPNTSARALRSLLAHEYGHVATFELGPKSNDIAWWALEGVAELAAERFVGNGSGRNAESLVIGWHTAKKLAAWDDLADFHKVQDSSPRDLQLKVYKQGQHMLMFISDTFGRDARTLWLREMSNGKSIEEASVAAFKTPFAEVDARWRAAVAALAEKSASEKSAKESAEKSDKEATKPKG